MYVRAGRPAFARPCVGIHKRDISYEFISASPAMSCMSGSSNLNSFRDRGAGGHTVGVLLGVAARTC